MYHTPLLGCYSTQSELARHDSRAHIQQLTIFSTTPACFACHATRDVNITTPRSGLENLHQHLLLKYKLEVRVSV